MTIRYWLAGALLFLATSCAGGPAPLSPAIPASAVRAPHASSRWIPTPGTTYQIQYDGKLDLSVPAAVYDLDMFDTHPATVAELHSQGRHAVCYVDVGTWENWRPDAKEFPKSVLGHKDGHWAGERWLDIRQTSILEPIMHARFALCKQKGFDAMDPDNLDGYENRTGFPLTSAQQLTYDTWVANDAHALGLTVDQKGDNDQVKQLENVYDFAVVEQCFAQGWCKQFTGYTSTNRLVVDVEYRLSTQEFQSKTCPSDAQYNETAILKKLELTAWIVTCKS